MKARLEALARRLLAEVPAGSPPGATPPAGVAIAVHHEGTDAATAVGDRGDGAPLGVGTAHDLASVTKVVATTSALMSLVSGRLLDLDDPVRRFVPAFAHPEVTVRDLLLHRGGLAEWFPLYLTARTHDEAVAAAARLPLRYRPREARHYSDLGFILLGRVVERTAGQGLAAAVGELVLEPLDLTSTAYAHPVGSDVATSALGDDLEMAMLDRDEPYPVGHRSAEFDRWRRKPIVGDVNDGNAFHAAGGTAGHAGLFSTPADLVAWARAVATVRGPWREDVVAEFTSPGPDAGQALGFRRYDVDAAGRSVVAVGHPGFVGCAVAFVPGHDTAVALATNRLLTPRVPVPTELMLGELLATLDDASGAAA